MLVVTQRVSQVRAEIVLLQPRVKRGLRLFEQSYAFRKAGFLRGHKR